MFTFKFDSNFKLGTATASTQIEGGDKNNTWYKWCEDGHIKDLSSSINACDHWNRLEEDTELLKKLKVQTHRMSLEWSRIQPDPYSFSKDAIDHYRYEIKLLLENNIEPLVTLHHFSEPLWFHESGGWLNVHNRELFIEYVKHVVTNLGDMVSQWVTFNEPNVYANLGYAVGVFPPGKRSLSEALKVSSAIIKTHAKVYKLIHEVRRDMGFKGNTMVGSAMHIRVFEGLSRSGKAIAWLIDKLFNEIYMIGIVEGKLLFPFKKIKKEKDRMATTKKQIKYCDFIGINYYTRNIVEFIFDPSNYFYKLLNDKDLKKSDLGWDIYPEGIYNVCKKYYNKYMIPVYITENGISDQYDNRKPDFIANHLYYISKAIQDGMDIRRYYYWTLMDNFEWLEGESTDFGLYDCDFKTQIRSIRRSGELYSKICDEKELNNEMIKEFFTNSKSEVNSFS